MVVEDNFFLDVVLPGGTNRTLTEAEWAAYRAPFREPPDRRPILRWIEQIPIAGQPADVVEIVRVNQDLLLRGTIARLLKYGDPGAVVGAAEVAWARAGGVELDVVDIGAGTHFLPEDQPAAMAEAIRRWLGVG